MYTNVESFLPKKRLTAGILRYDEQYP